MGMVQVDSELLAEEQAAGINVSRLAEQALAILTREELIDEIRRDQSALAEYISKHGNPAVELSQMFGHPCAT